MIANSSRDYRDLPHLTEGDDEFRAQFISWDLGDLTIVDINNYLAEKDLIIVPVASLEQHGPHLLLYTDTVTAVEMSRRVSQLIGVLHTPPIWMGYSPQHMHEPGHGRGTITMRSTTMLAIMHDVARSLIHHGFNRIIFMNGHGSNIKIVDPILRKLRYDTGALIGFVKPYMELLPRSFAKKDGMPDVEFDGYTYFNFPMDHHEFIESGVIGNPLRATKEKGEESFRRLSDHVARGILELMEVPVEIHNREFVDRVL